MTKLRILFVDDEEAVLRGLQNLLRKDRHRWDFVFASSGAAGLEQMRREPADIVVSDMRMPGMDGLEFLGNVQRELPRCARFVLSGQCENEAALRVVRITHQFFFKPCKVDVLRAAFERVETLRSYLDDPRVIEVVSSIDQLPSPAATFNAVSRLANDPTADLGALVAVIEQDAAVCAKVLQVVNSAYFGLPRQVVAVRDAVMYLGIELIKGLLLTTSGIAAAQALEAHPDPRFSLQDLQRRSLLTALLARQIVSPRELADLAYTTGLLHDLGKIVLFLTSREDFLRAIDLAGSSGMSSEQAEKQLLGASHAQAGAYLLGLWGLPFALVEATAHCHHPREVAPDQRALVESVYVASSLIDEAIDRAAGSPKCAALDEVDIDASGRSAELAGWREQAQQLATTGSGADLRAKVA